MNDQAKKLIDEVKAIGKFHAERAAAYTGGPKRFKHNGHDRDAAYPWLSDEEIAGMVRMLMRYDLNHEGVCCAARDRILHLSQRLSWLESVEVYAKTLEGVIARHDEKSNRPNFLRRLLTKLRTAK